MENENRLVNYVRAHRKRAGLSQLELALILGYRNEGVISRHELFRSVPPLLMALGYEVVFQTSVSELFPGLRETIENAIESSLAEFESALRTQQTQAARSQVPVITHKLEWLKERRELPGMKQRG
jgi:transcriptional regulator with XRE-family HTH domain